jgi:hypothetical protein
MKQCQKKKQLKLGCVMEVSNVPLILLTAEYPYRQHCIEHQAELCQQSAWL